jgi:hypothetical protein
MTAHNPSPTDAPEPRRLHCRICKAWFPLSSELEAHHRRHGWPRCHGEPMTLDPPGEPAQDDTPEPSG